MNWDAVFVIAVWGTFLFIWLPRKHALHRKRMSSLRAMNKGHRFKQKYKAIKALTGRSS
jgi:hypothetical protein